MLKDIRAVIFDLDGTLMDSMWMWTDIDIEYLGKYGYHYPMEQLRGVQKEIEGMSFTETAQYFKEHFSLPGSVVEIMQEWNQMAYEKYSTQVPLKPGALRFLQAMKKRGVSLGIASSSSRDLIQASLSGNHVGEYFDCITTSCDVSKGKPAPDVYLKTAKELGVRPENCLVFEDVPMGIHAGLNAGMRVCAVEDPFSETQREEIRRLADYYISSYDQLLDHTYEVL